MNGEKGRLLVKEIVVTYTVEGEGTQEERTFGLKHDGPGAAVDGFAWSRELMNRLAYIEEQAGEKCRPVQQKPGGKEWKRTRGKPKAADSDAAARAGTGTESGIMAAASLGTTAAGSGGTEPECIWLHQPNCEWLMICDW